MLRALAICLLLAPVAAGQRPRSRQSETPPAAILTFDATVTGDDGHPIQGLTAKDFELTHRGETRDIAGVTWAAGPRNIVIIVDDLGLAPERVSAQQDRLRTFIKELAAGDRAAFVRTSSGAGWQQELTTDRHPLLEQIERIQPVAHRISDATAANAISQSIRWAMDGLQAEGGRKAMVLLAEHSHIAALRRNESLTLAAHRAMLVFYVVDPDPATPIDLVTQTGGFVAPDLGAVLRDQEGYYTIAFRPAADGLQNIPPVLKLRDRAARLRWRNGYLGDAAPALAPTTTTAGGDLHVDLTALFTGYTRSAATVDVMIHVEGRDISTLRDLKGMRHGSTEIQVVPYSIGGKAPGSFGRAIEFDLDDAKHAQLLEDGTQFSTRITLPGSGGYQIRAIVNDGLSGRAGSAMEFLEIPPADKGMLAVSGLLLRRAEAAVDSTTEAAKPADVATVPVYKPGSIVRFIYGVFNATLGAEKNALLRVRTSLYAGGKVIYQGAPNDLQFLPAATGICQVNSRVNLDPHVSPGNYAIEVEVTDLLAKDGAPQVATQYRTFEVRE
jgi:hypothetical protein